MQIPITEVKNKRTKVPFKCQCGEIGYRRPQDIISGVLSCRRCAGIRRFYEEDKVLLRRQEVATKAAKISNTKPAEWRKLRQLCQAAKNRCVRKESTSYKNYGGRGIKFCFKSASDMAQWIVNNLGYPETGLSIDRINNNGNYEAGNLRWATRTEQANNKREYTRKEKGERIRKLQKAGSPFCYETLRSFITQGMTDEQILNRKKTNCGRRRVRHS